MRKLNQFSALQWLKLLPLQQAFKQARNDVLLAVYKRKQSKELDSFIAANRHLANQDIAIVIAFEQPWALNWLLKMAQKNLSNTTVLVFDNSRTESARAEIRRVCETHGTPYLLLPPYRTKHVNRSHGMAMTWVFHNVVRALKPRIFGYLDHDLIPVNPVDFSERLDRQPLFGLINAGQFGTWSTWAGYCLFRYDAIKNKSLNFLYDFSRDLDTGGRNWPHLYHQFEAGELRFAQKEHIEVAVPGIEQPRIVEFIDQRWIHIGGISYNDNFKEKFAFFEGVAQALEAGSSWQQLCTNPGNTVAPTA